MAAMPMGELMNDPTVSDFQRAISEQYGVESNALAGERVAVNGWMGDVLVFALLGHPMATFCYAWRTDSGVTVALHRTPIDSPREAVLSALGSTDVGHERLAEAEAARVQRAGTAPATTQPT